MSVPAIRPLAPLAIGVALVTIGLATGSCNAVLGTSSYTFRECSTTADCTSKLGSNHICRADKTCVNLLSADCKQIIGDYADDSSIIFGALITLSGSNTPNGLPELDALTVAMSDFQNAAVGSLPPAPGSNRRRPLAVVVCDDQATAAAGTSAAQHLVSNVRVPAIIGSHYSGVTINVANKVTIPGKVLLMSQGATSPDITNLQDDNLVWRSVASGTVETTRLVQLVADVEADIKSTLAQPPAPGDAGTGDAGTGDGGTPEAGASAGNIKIAIVYKGDAFGTGYQKGTVANLVFNGHKASDPENQPYFSTIDYGNIGDTMADPLNYPQTVQSLLRTRPHIIIMHATAEIYDNIIGPLEAGWDMAVPYRPRYVFDHSQFNAAVTTFLNKSDLTGSTRKRVYGMLGARIDDTYGAFRIEFQAYAAKTNSGTSADSFGAPNTYDAFFALAYGTTSLGALPITGPNLATNMAKLLPPGAPYPVGSGSLNQVLSLLSTGQGVNLEGASGPLDFDANGDVSAEMQVWCVSETADHKAGAPVITGYGFNPDGSRFATATFADAKKKCGLL